ncbi:hypothetical protein M2167_006424 [Streptomyces sp. SPB4]|nr:hypothetical protein [Streptomyces sp. SPB4]
MTWRPRSAPPRRSRSGGGSTGSARPYGPGNRRTGAESSWTPRRPGWCGNRARKPGRPSSPPCGPTGGPPDTSHPARTPSGAKTTTCCPSDSTWPTSAARRKERPGQGPGPGSGARSAAHRDQRGLGLPVATRLAAALPPPGGPGRRRRRPAPHRAGHRLRPRRHPQVAPAAKAAHRLGAAAARTAGTAGRDRCTARTGTLTRPRGQVAGRRGRARHNRHSSGARRRSRSGWSGKAPTGRPPRPQRGNHRRRRSTAGCCETRRMDHQHQNPTLQTHPGTPRRTAGARHDGLPGPSLNRKVSGTTE